MIDGVVWKELSTFPDERGYFRELIRETDGFFREGFGQWSVSFMHHGVAKAWHIHRIQTDWWYVASGVIKAVVHDLREQSPTKGTTMEWLMGDHHPAGILKIPPGVAHGCKCVGGPAQLFYITSKIYDPTDEGRLAHDDARIAYDWNAGVSIK